MTPAKLTIARQMLDSRQHTITEIAATIGVGRGTLYRHLPDPRVPATAHPDTNQRSGRQQDDPTWWRCGTTGSVTSAARAPCARPQVPVCPFSLVTAAASRSSGC